MTHTNDYLPADPDGLHTWLEDTLAAEAQQPRSSHHCAVVLKPAGQMIGWIGFQLSDAPSPGTVEFGYALSPAHWNQGYMTEAVRGMLAFCFEVLDAQSVKAFHLAHNPSSGRVLLKAGLRLDAEQMQNRSDGEVHFALTAQEWRS